MSSHTSPSDEYAAHASGTTRINDPGNGGLIDLASKSGGVLTLSGGGTRTLPSPPRGVMFYAFADSAVDLVSQSGDAVGTTSPSAGMMLVSAGSGVWAGVSYPQNSLLNLAGMSNVITGKSVGMTLMHESGGPDVASGHDNNAFLDEWYSGEWVDGVRGAFDISGMRFGVSSTWDLYSQEGFSFRTTGLGWVHAESEFGSDNLEASHKIGGMPSGPVWLNKSDLSSPVVRFRGASWDIGKFNIWGNYGTGSNAALIADAANRAAVGLEIQGQQDGIGVGKIEGSLAVMLCVTGVKLLPTPTEANADESRLFVFRPMYCDVGMEFGNEDSVGWKIDYLDHGTTPIAILFNRGSDLTIGTLLGQSLSTKGVYVRGNDTVTQGVIHIRHAQVDAQAPATYRVVHVDPTTGSNYQTINIDFLRGQYGRLAGEAYVELNNHKGELNISKGLAGVKGLIKATGGTATTPGTVRVERTSFLVGSDLSNPRKLFTADSRGYYNVVFNGCREEHGQTGHVNNGKLYAPYYGQINITGDGDSDYTET